MVQVHPHIKRADKSKPVKPSTGASQLSPVLELPMLKAKITEEASNLIIGITDPAEARDRLNVRY